MAFEAEWAATHVGAGPVLAGAVVLAGLREAFVYICQGSEHTDRQELHMCVCGVFKMSEVSYLGSTCLTALSTEALSALALEGSHQVPTRTAVKTRQRQTFIDLCRDWRRRH